MTTPLAAFGPTLALAEQTLTAGLHRHLAERDVTPETWYTLQLLAIRGPRLTREALVRGLQSSRTLTADSVREVLVRLDAEGIIHAGEEVELTPEGQALHRSLREYVTRPTAELLSHFDAADIDTTVRTLRAITKRADEDLAAGR